MDYERYHISAYCDGQHIGRVDPGGSTDEPGVRCMFGWGVPDIIVDLNKRDIFGHQILTEDAESRGVELRLYGFDPEINKWIDLGLIDGSQNEYIQRLLIK